MLIQFEQLMLSFRMGLKAVFNLSVPFQEESQLREKVCVMEEELCALREELRSRPTHSVITPVKTEPSEVTDTC